MRPLPGPTDAVQAMPPRRRGPLRPTAEIAADVLVPDDPALALALAQELLVRPRMANHSFGLWGYSGTAKLGGELTIQAAGIGAPSAASVLGDLAAHGASRVVRLGRCVAVAEELGSGTALVVEAALPRDGTSRALGAAEPLEPDRALAAALADAVPAMHLARIASVDSLAGPGAVEAVALGAGDAVALDLETAAIFALATRLGLAAGAVLVVSEPRVGAALGDQGLERRVLELGEAAARALAAEPAQASASETASLR